MRLVLVAIVGAVLLTGCGDDGGSDDAAEQYVDTMCTAFTGVAVEVEELVSENAGQTEVEVARLRVFVDDLDAALVPITEALETVEIPDVEGADLYHQQLEVRITEGLTLFDQARGGLDQQDVDTVDVLTLQIVLEPALTALGAIDFRFADAPAELADAYAGAAGCQELETRLSAITSLFVET